MKENLIETAKRTFWFFVIVSIVMYFWMVGRPEPTGRGVHREVRQLIPMHRRHALLGL